jgi:hypothetical protein
MRQFEPFHRRICHFFGNLGSGLAGHSEKIGPNFEGVGVEAEEALDREGRSQSRN